MVQDKLIWQGFAKDNIMSSWHRLEIFMDPDDNMVVYEEGDYNDAVCDLDDLFDDYSEFADGVVPVDVVTRADIMAMWDGAD
jgi:adenosine deaminase